MADHFVKIYGKMLDSSVWSLDSPTRIVWITMLTDADSTGFLETVPSALARRANVSIIECRAALQTLEAPDLESKNQDYAGRRIEKVERGWQLLNYQFYRDLRTESQVKRAERQARWRKKRRGDASTVDDVDGQRGEGRGEKGEVKGEMVSPRKISERLDRPATASPNMPGLMPAKDLPALRDHKWVEAFIEQLETKDWQTNRPGKEAVVAFKFHRWMNKITNRQVFNPQRERIAVKLLQSYGLVRCLLAIQGQRTHPDFNQEDRGRYFRGWDNLFRADKGFENIEKCSDHAIQRGDSKATLRALAQLQQERGWTPASADQELFSTIGGAK